MACSQEESRSRVCVWRSKLPSLVTSTTSEESKKTAKGTRDLNGAKSGAQITVLCSLSIAGVGWGYLSTALASMNHALERAAGESAMKGTCTTSFIHHFRRDAQSSSDSKRNSARKSARHLSHPHPHTCSHAAGARSGFVITNANANANANAQQRLSSFAIACIASR